MRVEFNPLPLLALGPLLRLAVEDRSSDFSEQASKPVFSWGAATLCRDSVLILLVAKLGSRTEQVELDAATITKEALAAQVYLLWRELQINYRKGSKA